MTERLDIDLRNAKLADLLRHFRKIGRMTQHELAEAIGVTDGMVGNVESGRRNMGIGAVEDVANVLGLSPDEREALRAARARYAGGHDGRAAPETPPSPEAAELLQVMQGMSEGLRDLGAAVQDLRDLVEQRLPDPDPN